MPGSLNVEGWEAKHVKRIVPLFLGLALLAAPAVSNATTNEFAQTGRFGLGLGAGALTSGLSGKFFLGEAVALQAVVGTWWGYGLSVNADAVFEMPSFFSNEAININWNLGAGAGTVLGTSAGLTVSGLAGLSLQIKQFPIELVGEFRPTFVFGDHWANTIYWGAGSHIRYFF